MRAKEELIEALENNEKILSWYDGIKTQTQSEISEKGSSKELREKLEWAINRSAVLRCKKGVLEWVLGDK